MTSSLTFISLTNC